MKFFSSLLSLYVLMNCSLIHAMYLPGQDCIAELASQKKEFRESINPLIDAIITARKETRRFPPLIVAIAGCSGVGKSKFAHRLMEILKEDGLNTVMFRMDDFYSQLLAKSLKCIHLHIAILIPIACIRY